MKAEISVPRHAADTGDSRILPQQESVSLSHARVAEPDTMPSRRLLLLERTMYRDGLAPFTSLFTVKLRGDLSEPRLRQALAQMQAKHPLLRCVVEQASGGPRFVQCSHPAPIPLRILDRITDSDWEIEARREWITPFGSARHPLARLIWLRGYGVHELMLVAHHCICDGPSGVTLLRDCFAAYDDLRSEAGTCQALGAIEDLIPKELLQDRAFRFRVRRRSALLRLALLVRAPRRSATRRSLRPDQMYFHRWQMNSAEAQALLERCRKEDTTVLAATSIAMLQAFREVRGTGALKHAYTMVNARRFLPRLHPEALFGMAPGVEIPIPVQTSPGKSTSCFWQSACAIREKMATRMARLGKHFYENLGALETLHDRYRRLVADTDAAPAVRHVTFSNLGRLDLPQQYRSFRIEHVYSPLVMVSPSPANTVVLSSFGGAMEFAIISDESSLPQTQARAIREKAMAILRASAAIAPQPASDSAPESCVQEATTP